MKDLFSKNSDEYAKYRPHYPSKVFDFIYANVADFQNAWDCGTGNGQVASRLTSRFKKVFATDISHNQIENAIHDKKIEYSVQPAEKASFPNQFFDLIIVAQAIHWFDFEKFYKEVYRTLKPEGLFVALGYGLLSISKVIDPIIDHLYKDIVGNFWEPERKYIDESYQTISFPFDEISSPDSSYKVSWTLDHLLGYLRTWSAAKKFIAKKEVDPIELVYDELVKSWGNMAERATRFPILFRAGKKSPESLKKKK